MTYSPPSVGLEILARQERSGLAIAVASELMRRDVSTRSQHSIKVRLLTRVNDAILTNRRGRVA